MSNEVFDYFKNQVYNQPGQSTLGAIGEGIGSLLLGNQVYNGASNTQSGIQDQIDSLSNMYGPNSPYTQQLRQSLARADAKAGRLSQYGTREVELQARLAALQGGNAATISNLRTQQQAANMQQQQIRAQQLSHLFNIANKTGATDWVTNKLGLNTLFGGQDRTPQASDYSQGGPSMGVYGVEPELQYQSNQGMGQMYGPTEQSAYTPEMDQSQSPTSSNNGYYMDWGY